MLQRQVFDLDRGWRFNSSVTSPHSGRDFDDSGWERVTLPHANTTVAWHSFDHFDYQFVSSYRRRFRLPPEATGRVFVDFDAVMTAAVVSCNGVRLGEHRGGFTPFSFELTDHVHPDGENVLAVEVDSTERPDVPPFGGRVDFLTFGGIYRDVTLRVVPDVFLADVFARPVRVLEPDRALDISGVVDARTAPDEPLVVEVELRDGDRVVAAATETFDAERAGVTTVDVSLHDLGSVELWDIEAPKLYTLTTRLRTGGTVDEHVSRVGFRDARFTSAGFFLNGHRVTLRGLNRHQTFPFVGGAMPRRVQRKDAEILKHDLKCNVVRTSHYPQSPHFLDRCDELGLLVVTEIPGWSHIGDDTWKELACRDVEAMVRRDRNHPSVILWGVRINESQDDRELYTRTNEIAHAMDDSRQTGGIRNFFESELLEDVFTINDFDPRKLRAPNHPLYLVTEFAGHTFPTKRTDHVDRVQEHVLRHAHVFDQIYGDERYAGGIGWCAFDYNTRADSGSGDHVCYHGVSDIFRIPKPAAALYRSQCDPRDEVVLEPAFHWSRGEFHWHAVEFHNAMYDGAAATEPPGRAVICSNCDTLRLYFGDELLVELEPDRAAFGNLPHPPFVTDALATRWGNRWHDLRIDGYIDGELAATRRMSGRGVDTQFHVTADDTVLDADGSDATRVVLRVTDEFGNPRPYATGAVTLTVDGPARIVGENPFALVGGVGAVWLRATETPGTARLQATHAVLGTQTVEIELVEAHTAAL